MRAHSGFRFAALLAGLAILCSPAAAQDRVNGESIAKTWCVGCHVVEGSTPQFGRTDAIPSFESVAQMPSTTATSLRVFLSTPHARMPDYSLTQREINDVSAYILSLKH